MRFSVRDRAQNALFRRVRFSSPAQTLSHLTQRRILRRRPHVKAHSAPGNSRKTALCTRRLTEKRTLYPATHGKAHSAPVVSRKSAFCTGDATSTWPKGAFWTGDVTERRILRAGLTKRRTLHAGGGCVERPFLPICVHSCILTTARAAGRGHGSHDIDGPMALVMPERSDLRPMPPGR